MKTKILILFYVFTINIVFSQPKNLYTPKVKQLLKEINTARSNPKEYYIVNNLLSERLDTLLSKQPLTLNYKLCQKAYKYSEYLANAKYNESNVSVSHSTMGYNESIGIHSDYSKLIYILILDQYIPSKAHRFHLLGVDNNDTKIGIGISYIVQLDWYIIVIVTE